MGVDGDDGRGADTPRISNPPNHELPKDRTREEGIKGIVIVGVFVTLAGLHNSLEIDSVLSRETTSDKTTFEIVGAPTQMSD